MSSVSLPFDFSRAEGEDGGLVSMPRDLPLDCRSIGMVLAKLSQGVAEESLLNKGHRILIGAENKDFPSFASRSMEWAVDNRQKD